MDQGAYWSGRLARQTLLFKEALHEAPWRELFERFVLWMTERKDPAPIVLKLPPLLSTFQILETIAPDPAAATAETWLERLTARELRRAELVLSFLHSVGIQIPSREAGENASDARRIDNALDEIRNSTHYEAARSFVNCQKESLGTEGGRSLRSIRLGTRAAVELVKFAGDQRIDTALTARFLKRSPGYRASLFAFITYLRAAQPDLAMPGRQNKAPDKLKSSVSDPAAATRYLKDGASFEDRRAAFAGWLVAMLGVPLRQAVKLPRSCITPGSDGSIWIEINKRRITIPNEVSQAVQRYLDDRDTAVLSRSEHLFPGRPEHHPVTTETLRARLLLHGVQVGHAGQVARRRIVRVAASIQ